MDSTTRTARIKQLTAEVKELQRRLINLVKGCPHEFECDYCHTQTTDEKCEKSQFGHGTAQCRVCGQWGSWYCPSSPDHNCYYFSYDENGTRKVELLNGTVVDKPADAQEFENEDFCLFCGNPDERK